MKYDKCNDYYAYTLTTPHDGSIEEMENTLVQRQSEIGALVSGYGEVEYVKEYHKSGYVHYHGIICMNPEKPCSFQDNAGTLGEIYTIVSMAQHSWDHICTPQQYFGWLRYMHKQESKSPPQQYYTKKEVQALSDPWSMHSLQVSCDELKKNFKKCRKQIKKISQLII